MDKVALVILAVIAVGFSAALGYWYQDRVPPTKIISEEVWNRAVRPGEFLYLDVVVERTRNDCRVHVERIIFDGIGARIPLPDEDFGAQPGETGRAASFKEPVFIPNYAAPGEARYRAIRSYWCNPLQRIFDWPVIVRTEDHPFRIVAR